MGHSGYLKGAARVVKTSSAGVERFDVTQLGGAAEGQRDDNYQGNLPHVWRG
jgi:hypothetical protein